MSSLSQTIPLEHLFAQLHQTQINLIQNTNKLNINEYAAQIAAICSTKTSQNVADSKAALEFLLLPLLTSLRRLNAQQRLNEWCDLNEALLRPVLQLLETFRSIDFALFTEVLNACSMLLSQLNSMSDELMSVCFHVISSLFTDHEEICCEFFRFSSLTTIGLLVAKLLDVLSMSKSIQVRLDTLHAFNSMLTSSSNKDCQHRIGLIYASFIPGISIKLMQKFLLAENLKLLNHKLICAGLQALRLAIAAVFDDHFLDEKEFYRCYNSCMNVDNRKSQLESLIVNRCESKAWLRESSEKVFFLIDKLLEVLIKHENINTKLELIRFCSTISDRCYFSLNAYLDKLLNVLVTFAVDVDDDDCEHENVVVVQATQAIQKLENKPNRFSLVSSSIHELLLKLPRLIAATDSKTELSDDSRVGYMRTVYGHLRLIGSTAQGDNKGRQLVDFFLSNLNNLNQLLDALVNCVKFDYSSLANFYEVDSDLAASGLSNYKGALDIYLHDKYLFGQLKNICSYLGRSDAARLCIDSLLNSDLVMLENRRYKLEALFLINLILVGLEQRDDEDDDGEKISIVNMILSNQLNEAKRLSSEPSRLDLIETLDLNENKTTSRNRYILQTCLTLEVIATTSRFFHCRLTSNQHLVFLIDTLYFTLENYTSANVLIKCVATRCLGELARNLGFSTPAQLLSANYDLLMNDLILKSAVLITRKHEQQQSSHVQVLCALIQVSDADLCAHLERLLDDYFFAAQLNPMNSELIDGICRVIGFVARSMRRWYPVKFNFVANEASCDLATLNLAAYANSKKREEEKMSFVEVLRQLDYEFAKQEKESSMLYEDNNEETKTDNQEKEEEMEEVKREAPLHVKLQTKCLELCIHLISHPNREIRLRVISLVGELSKNLAGYTNDYLPLVHKLWSPICHRFSLDDLVVKSRIIYVLFEMAVLSGDFLGQRFVKEFLPRLCQFMREQAKTSLNSASKNPTYVYSHAYKLQCSILDNIDKICLALDVKETQLEHVLDELVLAYLDRRQPKRLQLFAVQAIRNCALVDADVVWLFLLAYAIPFRSIQMSSSHSGDYERAQEVFKRAQMKMFGPKVDLQLSDDVLVSLLELFNTI